MGAKRNLRRPYGELRVFEQSLVFENICMFIQKDPETINDLITKLDEMLLKAYQYGRRDGQKAIKGKYQDFLNSMDQQEDK